MLVLPATMLAVRHFRLVVIRLAGLSRLGRLTRLRRLAWLGRLRRPFLGLHGDRALGGGRVAGLVYVSTYSPGFAASTEPDTLTASVTSPSTPSVADTPANGSNSESCSTVTSSTPESTGAIVSAGGTGFF